MIEITKKLTLVCTVLICIGILAPGTALPFSGSSGEDPTIMGPPWGLAISSDAPGIKLTGVVIIEYVQWSNQLPGGQDFADMARVVLRLSKGNDSKGNNDEHGNQEKGSQLRIFYDDIPGPLSPLDLPAIVQGRILTIMAGDVIEAFFPGETDLGITLKRLNKFAAVFGTPFIPRDAVEPAYGSCEVVSVLTCDVATDPLCDPLDLSFWTDILSCDGDYEFCGNGIDDDGDLKLDTDIRYLKDPDCTRRSIYTVSDIELAVK